MQSPWIAGLRSVALSVPDLAAAEASYTRICGLVIADVMTEDKAEADTAAAHATGGVLYLCGSGSDHHMAMAGTCSPHLARRRF